MVSALQEFSLPKIQLFIVCPFPSISFAILTFSECHWSAVYSDFIALCALETVTLAKKLFPAVFITNWIVREYYSSNSQTVVCRDFLPALVAVIEYLKCSRCTVQIKTQWKVVSLEANIFANYLWATRSNF